MSTSNNNGYINDKLLPITGFDPTSSAHTTFVQADPSTFRAVVQKLTGAPDRTTLPPCIPKQHPLKLLHERRHSLRKLEIKLNNNRNDVAWHPSTSPSSFSAIHRGGFLVGSSPSPVSPFEVLAVASPRTPVSDRCEEEIEEEEEEEKRAIAEKGFYLHKSPLSTPRDFEPQLLPLFPLHSPRDSN
ncbi:VQ protein [Dillenia turbinata]|uniref:VQ protein n=1 Tax=Dillenia turbinata TaxID=194707 RepID=A0AAN8UDZ0_9MAGN